MKKASGIFNIAMLLVVTLGIFSSCKKEAAFVPAGSGSSAASAADSVAGPDSSLIGLVSFFKFDDNAYDYSGTGKPAAYLYSISSAFDRFGNQYGALYFNGLNSYLDEPSNPDHVLNNIDFTINVWVNLYSYGGAYGSVIAGKRGDGPGNGWILSITNNSAANTVKPGVVSFVPGSTDHPAVDTTTVPLNKWCMITTTYAHAKKQCSIYINGVLSSVTNNVAAPAAGTTADLFIGRDNPSNKSQSYFFNGTMDDLRIYNRTISPSEIKKLVMLQD